MSFNSDSDNPHNESGDKSNELLYYLQKIDSRLCNLEQTIQILKTDVDNLQSNMEQIKSSTKNMDQHINFVERVYDVVKNPFTSMLRLYYRGNDPCIAMLENVDSNHDKNITQIE